MHDTTALEGAGIPTVFVASEVFEEAAQAQARSLGTTPGAVYVPHPIQDRTDEEIRELADRAIDDLLSALVHPS